MYNLFSKMCIPFFQYLLMTGGLQLLLGDQSVGESGMYSQYYWLLLKNFVPVPFLVSL